MEKHCVRITHIHTYTYINRAAGRSNVASFRLWFAQEIKIYNDIRRIFGINLQN